MAPEWSGGQGGHFPNVLSAETGCGYAWGWGGGFDEKLFLPRFLHERRGCLVPAWPVDSVELAPNREDQFLQQ